QAKYRHALRLLAVTFLPVWGGSAQSCLFRHCRSQPARCRQFRRLPLIRQIAKRRSNQLLWQGSPSKTSRKKRGSQARSMYLAGSSANNTFSKKPVAVSLSSTTTTMDGWTSSWLTAPALKESLHPIRQRIFYFTTIVMGPLPTLPRGQA